MNHAARRIAHLSLRANELLGPKRAQAWLVRPVKSLSHLSPIELAETSDVGASLALDALERRVGPPTELTEASASEEVWDRLDLGAEGEGAWRRLES